MRLDRGWSQEQLAGISGVSVRTIQRLEQGAPAGLESAKALAAAFGLTPADLQLNGKEAPMTAPSPTDETVALILCRQDTNRSPAERRRRFLHHLFAYAVVIGGLAVLNLSRNPDHLWVLYPAVIWGVFLAHRGLKLFALSRHRE
ncbi:MAG: helix-turn-helix domain-containing protein [Rhodospirillales bacterium]|nr:helix-turn-helix domain-containing protein [Rhodospirillales bacterium]